MVMTGGVRTSCTPPWSVNVNNSSIQNLVHPDDQTQTNQINLPHNHDSKILQD